MGLPRRRVLLPGVRDAVPPAGGSRHRGAGLGGDRAGGAHCRRRYRRACSCRVPATVTAPGPPKAIGKGLVSNAFIAHLLTERYVAGRSQNSLVIGLARHGADLSPATLTGTCAAAGALLAPLEVAITARSRGSWHLHADETSWRVFTPREDTPEGKGAGRPGEVVAVGVPRPGHRLLRHGPHPLGRGAGPPRRDRPDHRPTRRTPRHRPGRRRWRRPGGGAAAAGHLQRLLQRLQLGRPQGLRAGESLLLGPRPPILRAGRGRQPRPAQPTGPPPGWSGSRTCTPPTSS